MKINQNCFAIHKYIVYAFFIYLLKPFLENLFVVFTGLRQLIKEKARKVLCV
jgi:hypothetical protein